MMKFSLVLELITTLQTVILPFPINPKDTSFSDRQSTDFKRNLAQCHRQPKLVQAHMMLNYLNRTLNHQKVTKKWLSKTMPIVGQRETHSNPQRPLNLFLVLGHMLSQEFLKTLRLKLGAKTEFLAQLNVDSFSR
jgi:hypothetical protein